MKKITLLILVGMVVFNMAVCKNDSDSEQKNRIQGDEAVLAAGIKVREKPNTFSNPINISYQYQGDFRGRESADPAAIAYNGDYYLFASHGSGYWWSEDLVNWDFVYSTMPEIHKWAPAVCVYNGELYLTHSQEGKLYKSSNPKSGNAWTDIGQPFRWGDPALFVDDDGRVYAYEGLSPTAPIIGMELDPAKNMALVGSTEVLVNQHRAARGFENPGDNNQTINGGECWHEGAWMTKHNDKYYLQYAVPGTGLASYANGYYISDNPLGPFEFAQNSPVTFKATGFVRGAGHGSTIQDSKGNWWKFDTVAGVSSERIFERRLIMVPAAFDNDGRFITNMTFSDYPLYTPYSGLGTFDQPGPGWNLLSYGKAKNVSSTFSNYSADKAFDENIRSWWSAQTGDIGEWISADLGSVCNINAVQINFADQDVSMVSSKRNNTFRYRYLLEFSIDGEKWYPAVDRSNAVGEVNKAQDTSHDYFEFDQSRGQIAARYIRLTNKGPVPAGGKFAVSGLRVFGTDGSDAPGAVSGLSVNRLVSNERSATVSWNAVAGAEGYMVLWGAEGSGLPLHYQVIGTTQCTINALNMGTNYEFAVFAYNAGGIGSRSGVVTRNATQPIPLPPVPPEPVPGIDGYAKYEAELADRGPGVTVGNESGYASGGRILQNMHNSGAYFEIKNIDGGPGGNATLRLVYSQDNSTETRTEVVLNGVTVGVFTLLRTGGWNKFEVFEISLTNVSPDAANTIRFKGGQGGFNPDYIQLIYNQ